MEDKLSLGLSEPRNNADDTIDNFFFYSIINPDVLGTGFFSLIQYGIYSVWMHPPQGKVMKIRKANSVMMLLVYATLTLLTPVQINVVHSTVTWDIFTVAQIGWLSFTISYWVDRKDGWK